MYTKIENKLINVNHIVYITDVFEGESGYGAKYNGFVVQLTTGGTINIGGGAYLKCSFSRAEKEKTKNEHDRIIKEITKRKGGDV